MINILQVVYYWVLIKQVELCIYKYQELIQILLKLLLCMNQIKMSGLITKLEGFN